MANVNDLINVADLEAYHEESTPVKLIYGDIICEDIALNNETDENRTYTFPEPITLAVGDIFFIDYRYYDEENALNIDNSYKGLAFCKTAGSVYFLTASNNNSLNITNDSITDTWLSKSVNASSIVTIKRCTLESSMNGLNYVDGKKCINSGVRSHAEGNANVASGMYSHAEGYNNTASGDYSHAEGSNTIANLNAAHAEGYSTQATNTYAHAEGRVTYATGAYAHSEGQGNYAKGRSSHGEGECVNTTGTAAHAEGYKNWLNGFGAHVEGAGNSCAGQGAHVEGNGYTTTKINITGNASDTTYSIVSTLSSTVDYSEFVLGTAFFGTNIKTVRIENIDTENLTITFSETLGALTNQETTLIIGNSNTGRGAHVEGAFNKNKAENAHVEGESNYVDENSKSAHVEGGKNNTSGSTTKNNILVHIEGGFNNVTNSRYTHVEGSSNVISDHNGGHIEGLEHDITTGEFSHIEGNEQRLASGANATHVEGRRNGSGSIASHVEGGYNYSSSNAIYAHVEGTNNVAVGRNSHAEGDGAGGGYQGSGSFYEDMFNITSAVYDSSTDKTTVTIDSPILIKDNIHLSHYSTTTYDVLTIRVPRSNPTYTGTGTATSVNTFTLDGDVSEILLNAETYSLILKHNGGSYGDSSHSEGHETRAIGNYSHTEGTGTVAKYTNQHAGGTYNLNKEDDIFEIGNGSNMTSRSNALELTTSGNLKVSGTITDGQGNSFGKRVTATVSGTNVTFTDASITSDSIIEGPYFLNKLCTISDFEYSTGSVSYTLSDSDADGISAIIIVK